MYLMKNIINHNEDIILPKCMYYVKNPNDDLQDEIDRIDHIISSKKPKTKMADLEQRQEQLKQKLDFLYERIKTISSYCNTDSGQVTTKPSRAAKALVPNLEEVVLVAHPDNLPYYLNKILKESSVSVNLTWHIHSSVPREKIPKINGFVKHLKINNSTSKINLRLILKNLSTDPELKLSSVCEPIVGSVNILRYLSYAYPSCIPYDDTDFKLDSLLDICHLLEKSSEKNKEPLFKKLFTESKDWIYNNEFSILDLTVFNVVKQSKNSVKYVPKSWLDRCEKLSS